MSGSRSDSSVEHRILQTTAFSSEPGFVFELLTLIYESATSIQTTAATGHHDGRFRGFRATMAFVASSHVLQARLRFGMN